jgi:uncharacterized protein YeaO (DUF488 family)
MAISIVRLGSPRGKDEGVRIGTVRRPPRGVPKEEFASRDYYDVWLPMLSPGAELVAEARSAETEKEWQAFGRAFLKEMAVPDVARVLDMLALLSQGTNFAVGCYCEEESRCHRSLLRQLFEERGARIVCVSA